MKWTIENKYSQMMLRDYLLDVLQFSKRIVIRAKSEGGQILINGELKTVRYIIQTGDLLEVKLPPEKKSDFITIENIPLQIMYEDEFFLIINKEAGMPTIPSRLHTSGTIANALLYYYKKNNIPYTIHTVTRLDKDTSGLVLIAKHQYSHSLFSTMQRKNEINRKYIAIVHGNVDIKEGIINAPIGRKVDSIIERVVTDEGQEAITHYDVTEETANYTVVEVELVTGRTHQIRVHFSHIGHPLVGDDLYGGQKKLIDRQALHCSEIGFIHPFTNEEMTFRSKPPNEMMKLIENG